MQIEDWLDIKTSVFHFMNVYIYILLIFGHLKYSSSIFILLLFTNAFLNMFSWISPVSSFMNPYLCPMGIYIPALMFHCTSTELLITLIIQKQMIHYWSGWKKALNIGIKRKDKLVVDGSSLLAKVFGETTEINLGL